MVTKKNNLILNILLVSILFTSLTFAGSNFADSHLYYNKNMNENNYTSWNGSMEDFDFTSDTAALITNIIGSLKVLPAGSNDWLVPYEGDSLSFNDQINTSSNGRGKVVLSDGSVMKIGPDTSVEFVKGDEEGSISAVLSEGILWGAIKEQWT